ncbi:MAG: C25 family cysteine peptidase [Candidatus Cloacimonadaceae bacterium]|nr:C25 family cysteine peptidase [Candidatus Cloacimonadaceae bacterium]
MNTFSMSKWLLLCVIALVVVIMLPAQSRQIDLLGTPNSVALQNNTDLGFEVRYQVGNLTVREINTKKGLFDELSIGSYGYTNKVGDPKLPMMRQIIAVPIGAEVRLSILSRSEQELIATDSQLRNSIIPAQEPVSKSDDPETLPFVVNDKSYGIRGYGDLDEISVSEIGFMRGVRIFALDFHPVRYNPGQSSIRVIKDLRVQVEFLSPDLIATAQLLAKTASWEFDNLYQKSIFNWQRIDRPSLVRYPTKMVILTPAAYLSTLEPFVDWKKQQGLNVIVTTVGTGGTIANTTAAVQTYMNGLWSAATPQDPAPTYLLIVGDTSTSGNNIISNTGVTSTAHVTDLTYVRLQGTDYVPEMYYGRFSVSSATELTNIINKTLMFQQTTMPDPSYLGKTVLIAGVDATFATTHGNGAINYGSTQYFNASNGIVSNNYLYPASGTSDAQIIANANEGRGFINYTAHGSETSWADPTFTVTDVNAMTNTNKYFVAVGNCCITNKFNFTGGPCFGEAIIRAANKGGAAYIGGNNNTYWDEDYWWAVGAKGTANGTAPAYNAAALGAYDAMFHTHGEAFADWAQTTGETVYMGNLAVVQGGSSLTNYYWEIYSIMGDPSLMPYYGVPTVNTATYPSQILIGATTVNVTATPYSRVAITMNGVLYGTGIIPVNGTLALTITPFSSTGTAKMVITRQNKTTIMANVSVIANTGPYLAVGNNVYGDSNNNLPDYNETGRFTTTFTNSGSTAASNITATLTCSTTGITITDNTESIASLAAGASVTRTGAYTFNIANNIAHATSAQFTITMVSGADTWVHNFTLAINAPVLAFGTMIISDPTPANNNGRLDPGETVTISIPLNNTGGAASPTGSATLSSPTTGITIGSPTANFGSIAATGSVNLGFTVSAAAGMTVGTLATFNFNATAGAYTASKTENTAIGLIIEDFESGNFNSFPWTFSGNLPWTITGTGAYAGIYAAKSGTITHSQTSSMQTTRVLAASGTLTFWYKVTSEAGYDYLKFYVDGAIQNTPGWAGTIGWTQASYTLAAGTRVLRWEYMKDGSVSTGDDCAWIDNIVFPASTSSGVFNPPQNLTASPSHQSIKLDWQAPASGTPTGYKIFKNSVLLTTITALTYTDLAVTNGTSYAYYLKAVYSGGESDATATVNATPNAIAPTNLAAAAGNGFVNLSWTGATGRGELEEFSTSERAISGYKVYRNSAVLATVTTTTYNDTSVINETTYSYYVATVYSNPAGESAASNTVQAMPTAVVPSSAIIGAGTGITSTTTAAPINIYYQSLHGQSVYTAADLNAAGVFVPINITQVGFFVATAPSLALPNFVIRMKHTTATDAASWQTATDMVTVYTNASYMPVAGGYQMLTLSTPFLWNGTGNIVIDTAFGLIGSYTSTGTVQFTTVANGYLSTRNDTVNQTDVFSGGSVITSRPNLKLSLQPVATGPMIVANPASLVYGTISVGSNQVQQFTLQNSGDQTLTGTITTPAGYTVALAGRESAIGSSLQKTDIRNTLSFSIIAGQTRTYNLSFAPTAAISYSGNVVVSSNAVNNPTVNISVTGSGYIPPTIYIDNDFLGAVLLTGDESTDSFTISNLGSQPLSFNLALQELRHRGAQPLNTSHKAVKDRSIAGSTFSLNANDYTPGTTLNWTFTVYNASTDTEWLKDIYLSFPLGVIVNSATNFIGGSGGVMTPNPSSGNGITINWHGETASGWGVIYGAETATATVNVTIPSGFAGALTLAYQLNGDIYGAEPHILNGVIVLPQSIPPVEWFSAVPMSGTIQPGLNQTITGYFSAQGMETGIYEALITVYSNDPLNPERTVNVMMEVTGSINHAPTIDIPASFEFDKNGSLAVNFTPYVNDPDGDPLVLNYSGNTNVFVEINGLVVTFSAVQNWIGNENITFTVSDGIAMASDIASVTVNPVNMPSWTPVTYPNNPATIYGTVTIEGIPAIPGDLVGAFSTDECRGIGEVVTNAGIAYVTILVNLSGARETITLRVYSYAQDLVYPVAGTYNLGFGDVLGELDPLPINGSMITVLDTPVVNGFMSPSGFVLEWNPVPHADFYEIWHAELPEGPYTLIGTVSGLQFVHNARNVSAFFQVKAVMPSSRKETID